VRSQASNDERPAHAVNRTTLPLAVFGNAVTNRSVAGSL
jgi:hypothetical protein